MLHPPTTLLSSVTARIRASAHLHAHGTAHRLTCHAMGTPMNLAFSTPSVTAAHEFPRAALDWVARFEARYSRFCPDSIVGQINARNDWLDLDDETDQLLSTCAAMHTLTRGTFDPASLPLLRLWDYKANPPRLPTDADLRAALSLAGWDKVDRRPHAIRLPLPGMGVDLGGIGKEFAVDHLTNLARSFDIPDIMVDIGQDIRVAGRAPGKDAWYIGLEEPTQPGTCWTALRLTHHAIATSGDYHRSFTLNDRRYGHIIDPRTGLPVDNGCQSVTVVAPDCLTAGILATASFILGPTDALTLLQQHPTAQACITTQNARHQTRKFSSYVPA